MYIQFIVMSYCVSVIFKDLSLLINGGCPLQKGNHLDPILDGLLEFINDVLCGLKVGKV